MNSSHQKAFKMLLLLQYVDSGGTHSRENQQNQLLSERSRAAQKEGRKVGHQRLCSPESLKVCRCREKSPGGRGSAPPHGAGARGKHWLEPTTKDGSVILVLVTWPEFPQLLYGEDNTRVSLGFFNSSFASITLKSYV